MTPREEREYHGTWLFIAAIMLSGAHGELTSLIWIGLAVYHGYKFNKGFRGR